MKLFELLKDITKIAESSGDTEITDVVYDSRKVSPGSLFVAMPGIHVDGKKFIPKAIKAGAAAVAFSGEDSYEGAINIRVEDVKTFLGPVAHRFFDYPSSRMNIIGITGTNGKTTTTYIIESILKAAGKNVGVIGTINYRYEGKTFPAPNTTPLAVDLARLLSQMEQAGVDTVVMEVSSHALDQDRVLGVEFDGACFSNLSRDHLDYHKNIDDYFEAKKLFFSKFLTDSKKPEKFACVNLDDQYGVHMAAAYQGRVLTYGQNEGSDVRLRNAKVDFTGVCGRVTTPFGSFEIHSDLLGDFSVYNILAAIVISIGAGISTSKIKKGIENLERVPGRLEPVGKGDFLLLVDYAHTPHALENVLDSLMRLAKRRIITVFGCGGDRDPGKRPLMGDAVAQRSHVTIVTSDNPRTEDPNSIIEQILPGIEPHGLKTLNPDDLQNYEGGKGLVIEADRRAAINLAINAARKDDIVLIAGKGHEDYQIIGTTKHDFDDRVEALKALEALTKEGVLPIQ